MILWGKERTNERMYSTTKHITTLLLRSRVKNEQHFTPCNQRLEFLSNSSLHQPNTYKTHWTHSKLFVQTGVTIPSTYAKFCCVNVTRIQGKICGAENAIIFRIVEYFFIVQYFQKISGAGSVNEERYFGTQNIFLFYDIQKEKKIFR